MISAQLTCITTALTLTPQDFKAQLYAALVSMNYGYVPLPAPVDLNFRFLLPRVPIEWGQPRIEFTKLENATYCGLAIFDREDGGLSLDSAPFDRGPLSVWPGDRITCHIGWPG